MSMSMYMGGMGLTGRMGQADKGRMSMSGKGSMSGGKVAVRGARTRT
jgi:hypothetical protein